MRSIFISYVAICITSVLFAQSNIDLLFMAAPDIFVDFSFDDNKNGVDPVMEEIIEYL